MVITRCMEEGKGNRIRRRGWKDTTLVKCPVRLVSRLSTPGFDVGADGQDGGGKGLQQQACIHKFNVA